MRRKDDLPIVSALNDVMSDAGYNEPRPSWHGSLLLNIDLQVKMPGSVRKINPFPSSSLYPLYNLGEQVLYNIGCLKPHSDEAHHFGSSDGQSGTDPRSFCD